MPPPAEVVARRPAAHDRDRWRLLRSRPDLVHGRPSHRARPPPHPAAKPPSGSSVAVG